MLHTIRNDLNGLRARRHAARSRYRDKLAELPDGLFDYWAAHAAQEFKGIPRDAFFFVRAAECLVDFFDCVAFSGQTCALPSKAADSVWHAWRRYSPATLQQFCLKHFKRLIPHLEARDMPLPMDEALAVCLVASRRLAGLQAGGNNLPPLFGADAALRMPGGAGYRLADGRVGVGTLDGRGRRQDELMFPPALQPLALVDAGLVRAWETQACNPQLGGGGGGSGGELSCDGAADGGSGCGGGCGGGGGGD